MPRTLISLNEHKKNVRESKRKEIKREIATQILASLSTPCNLGSHNNNDQRECDAKVEMALRLTDTLLRKLETEYR